MFQAYAQSKLADLIFSLELQRRLKAVGSPILSTAAHPGYAVTNLQADHLPSGLKMLIRAMKPFLSQDAAHGSLPTLYAAVAPEAVAGGYYGPDGIAELKDYPTSVPVPKSALDETVAKRLWEESERLTRVNSPFPPRSLAMHSWPNEGIIDAKSLDKQFPWKVHWFPWKPQR